MKSILVILDDKGMVRLARGDAKDTASWRRMPVRLIPEFMGLAPGRYRVWAKRGEKYMLMGLKNGQMLVRRRSSARNKAGTDFTMCLTVIKRLGITAKRRYGALSVKAVGDGKAKVAGDV